MTLPRPSVFGRRTRHLSIRDKIILVSAAASSVSLGLAFLGILIFEMIHTPRSRAAELDSLARVLATNVEAPLAFGDAEAANEVLNALVGVYAIEEAWILDADGQRFASVTGDPSHIPLNDAFDPQRISLSHLDIEQPVRLDGREIGRLRMRVHIPELQARIKRLLLAMALSFLVSIACAIAVAFRLHPIISQPIRLLQDVLNYVTQEGDYRRRAAAVSNDEIGALVENFNFMLKAIEERDAQLRTSRDNLEEEVQHRTLELVRMNADLNIEKDRSEKAAAAKSEFLAAMSHELRTPMNAITGMTSLLLEGDHSQETRDYLRTVRNASETLLHLINDVLDFSKIESGKLELETIPFGLKECVEDVADMAVVRASQKKLNVFCKLDPRLPRAIRQDETRLRQILTNLASNAVKFTEHGEIGLAARLVETDGSRCTIEFCVSDTGIGIAPSGMDRLFLDFSQVDSSITRKFGGTGLGLAISKRLAEAMGGRIWVESEEGFGSRFLFTIQAEIEERPASPGRPELDPRLRTLAVVDEFAGNRNKLRQVAQEWNLSIRTIDPTREQPLRLLRELDFDVLFLGVGPGFTESDAHELWTDLRAHDARHFPTVVLQDRPLDLWADHEGPRVHLRRPLRAEELARSLRDPDHRDQDRHSRVPAPEPAFDILPPNTRVLVVEDNQVNQRVMRLLLDQLGINADTVSDGREAVESNRIKAYDVILMDVQMPIMDGVTATEIIREESGQPAHPWIIALTANVQAKDRDLYLGSGMNDFLGKPIRIEDLRQTLQRAELPHLARD